MRGAIEFEMQSDCSLNFERTGGLTTLSLGVADIREGQGIGGNESRVCHSVRAALRSFWPPCTASAGPPGSHSKPSF